MQFMVYLFRIDFVVQSEDKQDPVGYKLHIQRIVASVVPDLNR